MPVHRAPQEVPLGYSINFIDAFLDIRGVFVPTLQSRPKRHSPISVIRAQAANLIVSLTGYPITQNRNEKGPGADAGTRCFYTAYMPPATAWGRAQTYSVVPARR